MLRVSFSPGRDRDIFEKGPLDNTFFFSRTNQQAIPEQYFETSPCWGVGSKVRCGGVVMVSLKTKNDSYDLIKTRFSSRT